MELKAEVAGILLEHPLMNAAGTCKMLGASYWTKVVCSCRVKEGRSLDTNFNKHMEKETGKVLHWYDNIGVAVVRLDAGLKSGDRIKVVRGEEEFEDTVSSMEVDHQGVASAEKGQEVAIKLSQKAKQGALIFLIQ